jgi:hypothetical protein
MFLGIVLMAVAFFWILLDRKQTYDYSSGIDEKKTELLNIIEDAEEMMEELNKLSEYIIEQMDIKNEEMNRGIKKIDERLKQLDVELKESMSVKTYRPGKVSNGDSFNCKGISGSTFESFEREYKNESPKNDSSGTAHLHSGIQQIKSKEKVIPMKGRYKEVLKLSEDGLNETEIAKKLNIGKGEIQLILGMNK